jgi:predicted glycogen debranching enzyme
MVMRNLCPIEDSLCEGSLGREICGELEQALRREWLITNGIGGYAAGTLAGCQTRRYHGLLVAATAPPVGRTLFLVDLDVIAEVCGQRYELACHEYGGGVIHPQGHRLLQTFRLDGTVPIWTFALGPALLLRRVFMGRGHNTTYVQYSLVRGDAVVTLQLRPLCTARDYHWQRRGGAGFGVIASPQGCRVETTDGHPSLAITTDHGTFRESPDVHWNLFHREEAERGLDTTEDLYSPGIFEIRLEPGGSVVLCATIESQAVPAGDALAGLRAHETLLLNSAAVAEPMWIRRLVLAADQFIVARPRASSDGKTVIAGYPWFGDWGRDTMIALPGLALATGRPAIAAQVLRTFARFISEGMLPNRFPDAGEAPEYNTADATLWYFVALHEYLQFTGDIALARELWPALHEILDWHRRGTRHGIAMDPLDGLLRAGETGTQLTWMDAKVGGWVVTPRSGKAVEINALWYNALRIAAEVAASIGEPAMAVDCRARADTAIAAFRERFWYQAGGYLYDVIDAPARPPDHSLRPNQVLALALPHPLLEREQALSVLAACERELLTSHGLRTLAPSDPAYVGSYGGDQWQRDGAYHQGTVWPWLLGSFARAHYTLHRDRERAVSYLAPLEQHLMDACIGQISEIFDADPPHRPRGCFAQAWSVAEILRAWREIHGTMPAAPAV